MYLDARQYIRDTVQLFDQIRARIGYDMQIIHDVHERIPPIDAIRLAKALGWESLTFRQILEKAPPRQSQLLKPVFYDLEQKLGRLQKARKSSEQIIRVRLHELEGAIAQMQGGPYDNAGNVSLNPPAGSKMRDKYV